MICKKCGKEHDGSGMPPSYKGTIKMCYNCYRIMKNAISKRYFEKNPGMKRVYNKRALEKLTPQQKVDKWKDRTKRWKLNKVLRKAKKNLIGI